MIRLMFFFFFVVWGGFVNAQKIGWQNMDASKDSVFGMSTERAYAELLSGRLPKRVVVAIIDCGIDTSHEDLRGVLWTGKDGSHGRNYIASEGGREDVTNLVVGGRQYDQYLSFEVPKDSLDGYKRHEEYVRNYEGWVHTIQNYIEEVERNKLVLDSIVFRIGKRNPALSDFSWYEPRSDLEKSVVSTVVAVLPVYPDFNAYYKREVDYFLGALKRHLAVGLNMELPATKFDSSNGDVFPDAVGLLVKPSFTSWHGTRLAGVIAAVRNNGIGINGVADNVEIMMLKVASGILGIKNTNLANAIRFAVDNGAKVINISLGASDWDRKELDEALEYSRQHDVLIVHAAGNSHEDIDKALSDAFFPKEFYAENRLKGAPWLNVGAYGSLHDSVYVWPYSNYGRFTVDVFAPGADVYTLRPGSGYAFSSGTSISAPIVAGVAAILFGYFPKLTAMDVKKIIVSSVLKPERETVVGPGGTFKPVKLGNSCVSGGIVNVYNAVKLAATY